MPSPTPPRPVLAAWGVAVGLGVLAAAATLLANLLLVRAFSDAPRPDDLLFELLPSIWPARWLTVVALVGGFGVFLLDLVRHDGIRSRRLPAAGAVFALMYLTRAVLSVLTPLAPAHGEGAFVMEPQQYGMFPSGHVAALTLLLLLSPPERPWVRRVQAVMLVLMILGLLLARGHYSIDIVGGMLLSYVTLSAWRSWTVLRPLSRRTGE